MFYMPDRNLYIYGSDHNKLCYEIDLISILSYVIDFYVNLYLVSFINFISKKNIRYFASNVILISR